MPFWRTLVYRHLPSSRPEWVFTAKERDWATTQIDVSWSPTGNLIAISTAQTIEIWDTQNRTIFRSLYQRDQALLHPCHSIAWSPNGEALVGLIETHLWKGPGRPDPAGFYGQYTFRIWNVQTGEVLCTYRPFSHTFWHPLVLAWSPDGASIAYNDGEFICLWDAKTGQPLREYSDHRRVHVPKDRRVPYVTSVAFSPDSAFLISGNSESTIQIWRSTDGELLQHMDNQDAWRTSPAWSPDGTAIASSSEMRFLHLWEPHSGNTIVRHRLGTSTGFIAWSPDSQHLALTQGDFLIILNRKTGKQERIYRGHLRNKDLSPLWPDKGPHPPHMLSRSPDGKYIASAGQGSRPYACNYVHVWQTSLS